MIEPAPNPRQPEPILDALARHPFSKSLGEHHRMQIAPAGKLFRAASGQYLAREGDPANALYLIQSGCVDIGIHLGQRGAASIQTLGPGDMTGWSWALAPYLWQFDVRAVDAVEGLVLDAVWLRNQCEQDHSLGYQVLKQLVAVVSSRLASARIRQLDLYK